MQWLPEVLNRRDKVATGSPRPTLKPSFAFSSIVGDSDVNKLFNELVARDTRFAHVLNIQFSNGTFRTALLTLKRSAQFSRSKIEWIKA